MGGHYKSYVRSLKNPSVWWECNDDHVHRCSDEELSTLFLKESGSSFDQQQQQSSNVMENAYLLFYSRVSPSSATVEDYSSLVSSLIPVTKNIEEDNHHFETLIRLSSIQRKIIHMDISVYRINEISPINSTIYAFDFPKQTIFSEVTQQVYSFLLKEGILSSSEEFPLENCRLRKFSHTRNTKGETFGDNDRSSLSLAELGFLERETMCFEIRTTSDPSFIEYNPNEMVLSFFIWEGRDRDGEAKNTQEIESFIQSELLQSKEEGTTGVVTETNEQQSNKWIEITIPGREKATVQQLVDTVIEKFPVLQSVSDPSLLSFIPFIQNSNIPLHLLDDSSAELRKKYQIFPGTKIFIEISSQVCYNSEGEKDSKILSLLRSMRNKLCLLVNNPKITEEATEASYSIEVEATSDMTLGQLKTAIHKKLGLADGEEFYLKKNKDGIQFKEDEKTLNDLQITDQSIIHVQVSSFFSFFLSFFLSLYVLDG
jgi:hypothetical protein